MPIPTRRRNEDRSKFINRCMSDSTMVRENPNRNQRLAICNDQADKISKRSAWRGPEWLIAKK